MENCVELNVASERNLEEIYMVPVEVRADVPNASQPTSSKIVELQEAKCDAPLGFTKQISEVPNHEDKLMVMFMNIDKKFLPDVPPNFSRPFSFKNVDTTVPRFHTLLTKVERGIFLDIPLFFQPLGSKRGNSALDTVHNGSDNGVINIRDP